MIKNMLVEIKRMDPKLEKLLKKALSVKGGKVSDEGFDVLLHLSDHMARKEREIFALKSAGQHVIESLSNLDELTKGTK